MTYASEVLADSPLAYWRLGEASGTTMTDGSGNGRAGTYVGGPTLGSPGLLTGDPSTAAIFDGSTQRADVTPYAAWQDTIRTVEAWVEPSSTPARDCNILARHDASAAVWDLAQVSGKFRFRVRAGGFVSATSPDTSVAGQRYHVVGVMAATEIRLYVDGVLKATASTAPPSGAALLSVAALSGGYAGSGQYFPGKVDEVAVYGTALAQPRIETHYTSGTTASDPGAVASAVSLPAWGVAASLSIPDSGSPYRAMVLADNPLGYWRQENTAFGMNDSSPNARHGAYAFAVSNAAGLIAEGGGSVDFAPSGAYGRVASAAWMDVTTLTIEAWINTDALAGTQDIAARAVSSGTPVWQLQIASGKPQFITHGAGNQIITAPDSVVPGQTYHIVATFAAGTSRLYVNGVQVASGPGTLPASSNQVLAVAQDSNGSQQFDGRLDEVAFYGQALTAARVAEHYAQGVTAPGSQVSVAVQLPSWGVSGALSTAAAVSAATTLPAWSVTAVIDTDDDPGVTLLNTQLPAWDVGADLQAAAQLASTTALPSWVVAASVSPGVVPEPGAVTVATLLPAWGVSVAVLTPVGTGNAYLNQRVRTGVGEASWDPDVDPTPGGGGDPAETAPAWSLVHAQAWESYEVVGRQLRLTGHEAAARRGTRQRVVVAGRDLTYWRGIPTPEVDYTLTEPLLYGPATLNLPQIVSPWEQPGHGTLGWIKPGAPVIVQRVDPATDTVVQTVWVGRVLSIKPGADGTALGLMGQATGPAALRDVQVPLFRARNDLGFWWHGAIASLGLPVEEVETGIKLWNSGGSRLLNYMLDLAAKGWTSSGEQWTCMPDPREAGGTYRIRRKDRTTIHGTVYLDDALAVPDLTRDPAEEPSRMFPSGVNEDGRRIRFAARPVMGSAPAPPFPGVLSEGDTGDDVLAATWRLRVTGFLDLGDQGQVYDAEVTRAVRQLQRQARIPVTGNINAKTWDAMYDVGITGYDRAGTRILPAEEWDSTRRYDRTATGNVLGLNPGYDPDALVVDWTVNFGAGTSRREMLTWARRNLTDEARPNNWTGTITLNGGAVILGRHDPGDPLTAADVADALLLRPGMNLWLPTWDGGTLVHISAVRVSGGVVTLDVDTRARDALQVWEIRTRNQEARQNPARAFMLNQRSSGVPKDALVEWDDYSGVLDDAFTRLDAGWNVIPVPAGQEGTVGQIKLRTGHGGSDPVEYVVALLAREVPPDWLDGRIGDPLTEEGAEKWGDADVLDTLTDRFGLLAVWGDDKQPCGYFPRSKRNERTGAINAQYPLTGRMEDTAGVSYYTQGSERCLYLAVWVPRPTRLRPGRVLWNAMETGT